MDRTIPAQRVRANGVELAVDVIGSGPPLLFAHSLGSCRDAARRLLAPLADICRLILFDQRGHCASSAVTDPAGFDPRSMADDIAAVMDALRLDEAVIAGESMGAATALLFATRFPKRLTRLIQIAPTVVDQPNPARDMIRALADFTAAHGLQVAADAVALASMGHGIPRAAAHMITECWTHHDLDSFVTAHRVVPDWVLFDSLAPVTALRVPIAVIAWGGDPSRPLPQARRLAAAARNGHLEVLESLATVAATPTLYADAIRRVLMPERPR